MTVDKLIAKSNGKSEAKKQREPFSIEEANAAQDDSYKIYTRRWFMLLVPLSSEVLLAFRSWRFPIVNVVYPFWDTTVTRCAAWWTIPLIIHALILLPSGRALDRWGIRKMVYVTAPILIASNVVQSIIMMDETNSIIWIPKCYRFGTFIFCNVLMMISMSNFIGLTAKVANDWFALKETTLVLVLPLMVSRSFEAMVALVTPMIVKSSDDLKYIGYMNLALISMFALIVITCVTRSEPRVPPSKNAQLARQSFEPPLTAFIQIIKIPSFAFAMIAYGFNATSQSMMKAILCEALSLHGYSNEFSGILIAFASITTCLGGFTGAWLDRNYDYVIVSKIIGLFMATTFCIHYMSQLIENIGYVIIASGTLLSFFHSILIPLQMQAMLRPSKGILPDASVACLNAFVSAICNGILTTFLTVIQKYAPPDDHYFRPYVTFCVIIILANVAYAIGYNLPNQLKEDAKDKKNEADGNNIDTSC